MYKSLIKILQRLNSLDPDRHFLFHSFVITISASIGTLYWLTFNVTGFVLFLAMVPANSAMLAFPLPRWSRRIKLMFELSLATAVFQSITTMLSEQIYLLLLWGFIATFFTFCSIKRIIYVLALLPGFVICLSLSSTYMAAVSRNIDIIISFFITLVCLFIVLEFFAKYRIRITLTLYLKALIKGFELRSGVITDKTSEQDKTIQKQLQKYSLKADNLVFHERYFFRNNNRYAKNAAYIMKHLYIVSRSMCFIKPGMSENNKPIKELTDQINQSLVELLQSVKNESCFYLSDSLTKFDWTDIKSKDSMNFQLNYAYIGLINELASLNGCSIKGNINEFSSI
jgi:hypothetical protein